MDFSNWVIWAIIAVILVVLALIGYISESMKKSKNRDDNSSLEGNNTSNVSAKQETTASVNVTPIQTVTPAESVVPTPSVSAEPISTLTESQTVAPVETLNTDMPETNVNVVSETSSSPVLPEVTPLPSEIQSSDISASKPDDNVWNS